MQFATVFAFEDRDISRLSVKGVWHIPSTDAKMANLIRQTLERFEAYADGTDDSMIPFQKYPRFSDLTLTADDMLIAYIRKAKYSPPAHFRRNKPSFLALCLQKIKEGEYENKDVDIHVGDNRTVVSATWGITGQL